MPSIEQKSAPVREGDVLAGKYRIEKVLGAGGMGIVVAARHMDLDERVAIKFLLPETLSNAEAVARFAREARAAVKIKSEHVARVSDVGKLENGAPFMVMEYLDGGDLAAWLTQHGALAVDQAAEFVLQACEAIAEAHALGIVHRDLKPANLFVIKRPDGALSVKVLDFGISKVTGLAGSDGAGSMTKTSAMMGSPLYMSPEQMQSSRDVDARGDIWALGVILFELVTGAPPFLAETMPELVLRIIGGAPEPLRERRPDAPEGLEAVILRCLEKNRDQRFRTVGEFAQALLPFAPKRARASVERIAGVMKAAGFSATTLPPGSSSDVDSTPPAGAHTAASWGQTANSKQQRSPWTAVATVGVVGLLAGIGFASRHGAESREADSRSAAVSAPAVSVRSPAPDLPALHAEVAPSPKPVAPPVEIAAERTIARAGRTSPAHVGHGTAGPAPKPTAAALVQPAAATPIQPVAATPIRPAASPAPTTSGTNCDPAFYFDSQGNKHFKPECFH